MSSTTEQPPAGRARSWAVVVLILSLLPTAGRADSLQPCPDVVEAGDAGVPDKFYPAQSAVILTPDPRLVESGCWATPKACIDAATERAGLKAQVKRLESTAADDLRGYVWALLGVGAAAGIALGLVIGYFAWGTH